MQGIASNMPVKIAKPILNERGKPTGKYNFKVSTIGEVQKMIMADPRGPVEAYKALRFADDSGTRVWNPDPSTHGRVGVLPGTRRFDKSAYAAGRTTQVAFGKDPTKLTKIQIGGAGLKQMSSDLGIFDGSDEGYQNLSLRATLESMGKAPLSPEAQKWSTFMNRLGTGLNEQFDQSLDAGQ